MTAAQLAPYQGRREGLHYVLHFLPRRLVNDSVSAIPHPF